jgi:hypothetical protein
VAITETLPLVSRHLAVDHHAWAWRFRFSFPLDRSLATRGFGSRESYSIEHDRAEG